MKDNVAESDTKVVQYVMFP